MSTSTTVIIVVFVFLFYTEARRRPCPETTTWPSFPSTTTRSTTPPLPACPTQHEKWMQVGCENTCDDVPVKNCTEDPNHPDCAPGCYCWVDPNTDFWRPAVRNANGSCVYYYECQNPHYQCCPPCGPTERCDIGIYNCPRAPCPFPYARCVPA
ncbi:hypothetical protein L596_013089 [Steinernema carpocapsae]|uniref:TIL domain-containing protein n=1 Tax=Steinernema carpocapsae TaxID=34508 RepID=A0A4U5NZ21_STECR|nr:hypothetical protein L596_013089 [Steinernema carpocapsae]